MTSCDVAILGGGSAAETAAEHLAATGRSVVVVEERLVGGECPFLACVPSKAVLHAAAAGRSWADAVAFRDRTTHHRDDGGHVRALERHGAALMRGHAVVSGSGRLDVDGDVVEWKDLVVATGARPVVPEIEGIDTVPVWTSEDALVTDTRPGALLILGGGPIGCELAQAFARLGSEVTVLEVAEHLLPNEPRFVGETVTEALRHDGVEVVTEAAVVRVEPAGDGVAVILDDDDRILGDRLLVAVGKRPRTSGLGLERLGVTIGDDGRLVVDENGRAADHVWGAGDVTALAPYTHAANAQARLVAANIAGGRQQFDLHAVPRCVFTDPAVMCVGRTDGNPGVISGGFDVGRTARATIEEQPAGRVELFADGDRGVLIGAALVGAHADAWGGELVVAVQAALPVSTLAAVMHPFPTFAEALEPAYNEILDQLAGRRR